MESWRYCLCIVNLKTFLSTDQRRLTQCFPFWSTKITVQYRKIMHGIFSWPKSSTISEIGWHQVTWFLLR